MVYLLLRTDPSMLIAAMVPIRPADKRVHIINQLARPAFSDGKSLVSRLVSLRHETKR